MIHVNRGATALGVFYEKTSAKALCLILITPILGIAISKLGNTTAIAKSMCVQADIQAIKTQLQLYKSMNGFYPTSKQGLQSLVTQPQNDPRPTRGYQLFKELPKDPWGSNYIYRNPGLKTLRATIYIQQAGPAAGQSPGFLLEGTGV